MGLRHRGLRAVEDVGAQAAATGQIATGAIDVPHALPVDQEQMVDTRSADDVDVFAQFDIARGAEAW